MVKYERKVVDWICSKIYIIAILAITVIGIVIRYAHRDFVSGDYKWFLSQWYDEIRANGGLEGLHIQVGDYNLVYQFLIAIMTKFPLDALYAYKILSCFFDFMLAILVSYFVYYLSDYERERNACITYAITLLLPVVFLNSACWAQCDSIYVFFLVFSLFALMKDKHILAFILYGISFAFKMQAIFLLPFFVFAYIVKKKFSVLHFILIPIAMILVNIPSFIKGRKLIDVFQIYILQTSVYEKVHMNYPSFWTILNSSRDTPDFEGFKTMAIWLTCAVLGIIIVLLLAQKIQWDYKVGIYSALILSYTCVLFLPSMHERYGYLYEVLAIIVLFMNKKTIPLFFSLMYMSMSTYGYYLFQTEIDIRKLGILNVAIYLLYCYVLWKDMVKAQASNEILLEGEK